MRFFTSIKKRVGVLYKTVTLLKILTDVFFPDNTGLQQAG